MTGIFKGKYELHGRDWVRKISPEDQKFFIDLGMQAMEYGKLGGSFRAATAKRDGRGRFARNCDGGNRKTDNPQADQTRGDQIASLESEIPF